MCMSIILPMEAIKKIPDKITAYKVVKKNSDKKAYRPIFFYYPEGYFKEGVNIANTSSVCISNTIKRKFLIFPIIESASYNAGYHFWLKKKDAERYKKGIDDPSPIEIIECEINKEDIIAVRKMPEYTKGIAIVAKKATFPKFKELS